MSPGHGRRRRDVLWDNGAFNAQKIFATRPDSDGSYAWTPNVIEACTTLSGKGAIVDVGERRQQSRPAHLERQPAMLPERHLRYVNLDGSLGTPGDVDDDGSVNINDLLDVINNWGMLQRPRTPAFYTPRTFRPLRQATGRSTLTIYAGHHQQLGLIRRNRSNQPEFSRSHAPGPLSPGAFLFTGLEIIRTTGSTTLVTAEERPARV